MRISAIRALRKMGASAHAALPAIAERLKDPDAEVRCEAATALAQFKATSRPYLPGLRTALHDDSEEVRDAAREAILLVGFEEK